MSSIVITAAGKTGTEVYEVTGFERLVYADLVTTYNPAKLYRIRASIKNTVAPTGALGNLVRVGVEGLAADGSTLVGTDGSATVSGQYFVAANDHDMGGETLGEWVDFVGYVSGQGEYVVAPTTAASPSPMHADVAYIRPVVWINMPDGDGTCQVDGVLLDNIVEPAENINALVQWTDIGSGSAFTGSQAAAALNVDIATIPDGGCAGRIGTFYLDEELAHDIGNFCTLSPLDGYMHFAGLADGSATWFPALNLYAGGGLQSFALPGGFVRNDAWSWVPGKDVYLSPGGYGGMTQRDPDDGIPRFKVGQAVASNLLYFAPQDNFAVDLDCFAALPTYDCDTVTPQAVLYWNSGLLLGCSGGKILRSTDYGLTFTTVLDAGTGYSFRAFAEFDGYLYACADHSPGFALYRSANGLADSWSQSYLDTTEPYAADLHVFGGKLLIGTSGTYPKIYSTTSGTSVTNRFTGSKGQAFVRFASTSTNVYALTDGSTARTRMSVDGVTWTLSASFTGYPVGIDLQAYTLGSTEWCLVVVNDGAVNNRIATYDGTVELDTVGNKPNGFLLHDNVLYLAGGDTSGEGLYRRVMTSDSVLDEWEIYARSVAAGGCRRFELAPNGYVYCLRPNDSILYKIPRAQLLVT